MKGKSISKIKKTRLLLAVFILVLALSVGIALAYMFRVTDSITNQFERAVVQCQVAEQFDAATGVKSSICVKNTGTIDEYLRVKLVSYWVDSEGNIIPKQATIPEFSPAAGWIDTGDHVYRYDSPIVPNALTPNLFAAEQSITLATDVDGSCQVIEVFAEAIQTNAIAEWTH